MIIQKNGKRSNRVYDSNSDDPISYTGARKLFRIKISANGIVKHFRVIHKAEVVECQDPKKLENYNERYSQFICSINENTTYSEFDNFIEGDNLILLFDSICTDLKLKKIVVKNYHH
jgi:hypothetical protein